MSEKPGVRALSRGLAVLVAVNEAPPASVSNVVTATGLAKATVVRLLKSLCEEGYLVAIPTGGYRPLPKVRRLASAMIVEDPFLSEVKRALNEFGRSTKWPADFLVADVDAMLIVASNRDSAPITLARFEHRRFPLLESAAGRAFMSALDPKQCQDIVLNTAYRNPDTTKAKAIADQVNEDIMLIKKRGYSIKDFNAPLEGVRAFGVPVTSDDRAIGALVLVVIRDIVSTEAFESKLLPAMQSQACHFGRLNSVNSSDLVLAITNT